MADVRRASDADGQVAEGSLAFTVTKPVDLSVLDAELSQAMNWRKDSGLVSDGVAAEASSDNPVTVWVLRGEEVDTNTFKSVVNAHDIETAGQVETEEHPLQYLREKVKAGEDLSPGEVKDVLAHYVLSVTQDIADVES